MSEGVFLVDYHKFERRKTMRSAYFLVYSYLKNSSTKTYASTNSPLRVAEDAEVMRTRTVCPV